MACGRSVCPDSVVDMVTKVVGVSTVAIKQRWIDRFWQRACDEHGMACQRHRNDLAGLLPGRRFFRQLQVVFNGTTQAACGDAGHGLESTVWQALALNAGTWVSMRDILISGGLLNSFEIRLKCGKYWFEIHAAALG